MFSNKKFRGALDMELSKHDIYNNEYEQSSIFLKKS